MIRRFVTTSVLVMLVLGCSKKSKFTGASEDTASAPNAASVGDKVKLIEKDKGPQGEKPNWLNDPRFNKKGEGGNLPVEPPPNGGKPGLGPTPPAGGLLPPNTGAVPGNPTVQPAGPAQPGAPNPQLPPAQPMTPAAQGGKPVAKADMNEVWIFMENASIVNGKLPPPQLVYAALVEAKSPAADLVKSGYIILTGATTRESVWAFEKNAPTSGGWIATQNGPEQVSAVEFAKLLGR